MANFVVTYGILDGDGATSLVKSHLVAATVAAAATAAEALAVLIDDIVLGQIVSCSITAEEDISGWGLDSAPTAGSDNEVKGRFIFRDASEFHARISLPSFNKDTFTLSGGGIDLGATQISDFVTEFLASGWATSHYDDLTAVVKAYEAFGR